MIKITKKYFSSFPVISLLVLLSGFSPINVLAADGNDNVASLGGFPVVISPYTGSDRAYDGSDLLTNSSGQNGDLLALQYRQDISDAFSDSKTKMSDYYLILSGGLSAQVYGTKPYVGPNISDIDLITANITALAGMGKWVTGFFSFDFDNAPPNALNPPQVGTRSDNSRIYLEQGYMTIGNLDKSNWYGSVGQMYIPFGVFNGYMINSPLTSTLFSMIERPISLGYSHKHDINDNDSTEFDAGAYVFQGETTTSLNSSAINEWGADINYTITKSKWNGTVGVGYISNIADAEGIQLNGQSTNGCTLFGGFAFSCGRGNVLQHRVSGFDLNAAYTYQAYNFIAEYVTAINAFSPLDLSFNNKGAKPQAFDFEAAYAFFVYNKPSNIAVGYTITKDSLGLLLPAQEYSISFNTSLWRDTNESIEFQHDVNYGSSDTASGQLLPVIPNRGRVNLGKSSDTILLAISAYF